MFPLAQGYVSASFPPVGAAIGYFVALLVEQAIFTGQDERDLRDDEIAREAIVWAEKTGAVNPPVPNQDTMSESN